MSRLFDRFFITNSLKNITCCPKCRKNYDFHYDKSIKDNHVKSNRPILLPCGHNMCENCVFHNRHNLACAVCLSPISVAREPTKQFSNFNVRDYFDMNFFLMGELNHWRFYRKEGSANNTLYMSAAGRTSLNSTLLDTDASVATSSIIKCIECEFVPSIGKCRICKAYYCKRCFDNIHKNSKVLKMHTLQRFDKESAKQSEVVRLTRTRFCNRHQRQSDRYCKKCDYVCCGECARLDHQHHHYRKLIEENDKLMEDLRVTLDNAQVARENLNRGQKDIKSVETQFEEYATKTLEEISNYFLQLHSFLQNEEKRIMEKFSEMSQQPQFMLREANVKLNESHETLNSIRSILEQYQHSPPANFYLGHILPKYNQLINQIPSNIQITKPQTNPFVFEVKNDIRSEIQNSIAYSYKDPSLLIKIDTSFYGSNTSIMDTTGASMPSFFNMTHNKITSPKPKKNNKNKKNKKANNNNVVQDVALTSMTPPNSNYNGVNLVRVTNIKSPENFFIQNINDIESIRQLSHAYLCNVFASNLPKTITEGYYYMAYHVNDKLWYRGMLKKILPNNIYKIFLVDFGLDIEVPKDRLCDIEEQHLKIPFAAMRCAIYDIMPMGKKWTEVENNLLLELVQNKPARISIIEKVNNEMYKIDLHTDLSKSVHDTFLYTGLARERPGVNSFKLQVKANLPIVKIEERIPKTNISPNEILAVTVLHVEGPEEFFVIKNELIDSKEELKIELNQYYHNSSSKVQQLYLGNVQMCCAVIVNDIWYRAVIEEIKDKGLLNVRLVDEGRRELINWRQAFVLAEIFRNKREFAIPCTLAGIEPLQENNYCYTLAAVKDFKQMTTNPQLRMEVVAVTPKIYKVVLYICKKELDINIGAALVKNKYGVSTGESTLVTEIVKTPKFKKNNHPLEIISNDDNMKGIVPLNTIKRSVVKVTHLNSPGEFYIQLVSLAQGTRTFHQQIQEAQAKKCGTKQPLPHETREWYEDNHCLVYTKYHSSQFTQPIDGPLLEQFEWYRGVITKITYLPGEEPTFSVFLRDIGVTICSIYSQQLYSIDPQLDRVTNAVYCCQLACIEPAGGKTWSQSAIDTFTHYIRTAETLSVSLHGKRNRDRNSLAIVLWSSKIETANPLAPCIAKYSNINRNLVRKGLAHMVEPLDTKQQFDQIEEMELAHGEITLEQWFKSFSDNVLLKEIENNEKLPLYLSGNTDDAIDNNEMYIDDHPLSKFLNEIDFEETTGQKAPPAWLSSKVITKTMFTGYPTYIDFDCIIYLHEAEDKKFLEKITKKLTEIYGSMEQPSSDTLSRFAVDQACVAKYHVDSKYYRGIITEDVNFQNEWSVQFIDYGNVETVEGKDLRPFAPFRNLPAMANKYIIDGIKPTGGAKKFSIDQLDQMHTLLVTKFVSIRIQSNQLQKTVKRCTMRLGSKDMASDFIERGLAEAEYKPLCDQSLNETVNLNLNQLEANPSVVGLSKPRKSRNPLPPSSHDDYAIFSQGNNSNISIDHNYIQTAIENINEHHNDLSDSSADADDDDDDVDNDKFDRLNEMLDRLSKNAKVEQLTKPTTKTATESAFNINATNKPPPKKRMFNDNDYVKMMNVMMVYDNDNIVDNLDQDPDYDYINVEDEDDDIIELGESFAMNYWHSTAEDMRIEEDEEINEQLERRVSSFKEDIDSDFDSFHPNDTSTAFSHFSGIENFKAPQLPTAMHHFKCRVVSIITPLILQIFPLHNEFRYRDVELQRSIKELVRQSLPPLTTLEPRTLCLACYTKDKNWYRAVVRSYNPTAKTVDVLYVDYLNSETLPLKYVRQCPKELLGWPLRTFRVRLHGIEVNSKVKEHEIRLALQNVVAKHDLFAVVKKHPIFSDTILGKTLTSPDLIEIALYESKEESLKGITIYEPLIEKNYFQRF